MHMYNSFTYHEAMQGSVVGVEKEWNESTGLGGPVPTIRAMDHHTHLLLAQGLGWILVSDT